MTRTNHREGLRRTSGRRDAGTVPRNGLAGNLASNRAVENSIKRVTSHVRTTTSALEGQLTTKLPTDHPVLEWLVERVARSITRYAVRKNGRTAYETITGRKSETAVAVFGETVMYMHLRASKRNMAKV